MYTAIQCPYTHVRAQARTHANTQMRTQHRAWITAWERGVTLFINPADASIAPPPPPRGRVTAWINAGYFRRRGVFINLNVGIDLGPL